MKYCLTAIPLLLWASFAGAEAPRTDLYGDPLPAGAVVRLGTAQMRLTNGCDTTLLPDGKTVVIAFRHRALQYWDIASGKLIRTRTVGDDSGPVEQITLSSDGKTLAMLRSGRWVFWDVEANQEVAAWTPAKAQRQWPILWDGQSFAVLREDDNRVLLWDLRTRKERAIAFAARRFGTDSTYHATISPDKKFVVGLARRRSTSPSPALTHSSRSPSLRTASAWPVVSPTTAS